jgi:hypothetical protein
MELSPAHFAQNAAPLHPLRKAEKQRIPRFPFFFPYFNCHGERIIQKNFLRKGTKKKIARFQKEEEAYGAYEKIEPAPQHGARFRRKISISTRKWRKQLFWNENFSSGPEKLIYRGEKPDNSHLYRGKYKWMLDFF